MTTEELARKAYEAYAGAFGIGRTPGGKAWEDLPPPRRRAWAKVAGVVRETRLEGLDDEQLDELVRDLDERLDAAVRENNRRAAGKLLEGDAS